MYICICIYIYIYIYIYITLVRLYASISYKTIHKTSSRNSLLSIHVRIYL